MAAITPLEFAKRLKDQNRHLDATYVLETSLLMGSADPKARLLLAQLYLYLKEGRYRVLARDHYERILADGAPPETLRIAAYQLVRNVYLAMGPVEKAGPILEQYPEAFNADETAFIRRKIGEIDSYLNLGSKTRGRSSMPATVAEVSNNDLALKGFIFREFRAQVAQKDASGAYFTFGSCFAGNVARAMKAAGLAVESFWVGEEVNTTFSNVNLLRFILGEPVEHADYYRWALLAQDVDHLRAALTSAENVIYTLGVAPAFFDGEGRYTPHNPENIKPLLRQKDVVYRFSTVEENVGELQAMRALLARHTKVRNVFLTVSPVPLVASLLSAAAPVDDSESKAILRAAAGLACRAEPNIFTYFPSFEAFRWLPSFQDQAAFGADDGVLRHANGTLVDQVVALFLESTRAGVIAEA